jgi:segregation and condensation protein A
MEAPQLNRPAPVQQPQTGHAGDHTGLPAEYRVHLDMFEGPLDLLLYLIRRDEVEITDIPIAAMADQYMAYLSQIDRIDIELAGEFLLTAATLMEIKSRMLTPRPATPDEGEQRASRRGEEDPRAELVRQLLEYKKYRDATDALEARRQEWERRAPAAKAGVESEALREALMAQAGELDLEDLTIVDLVEAFQKIAASVNFERLGEHKVEYDDTPIELHAEDIVDRLKSLETEAAAAVGAVGLSLRSMFSGRSRGEMIGLFLATLELVRRRIVAVRQDDAGEISLSLRPAEAEPGAQEPAAPLPPGPAAD